MAAPPSTPAKDMSLQPMAPAPTPEEDAAAALIRLTPIALKADSDDAEGEDDSEDSEPSMRPMVLDDDAPAAAEPAASSDEPVVTAATADNAAGGGETNDALAAPPPAPADTTNTTDVIATAAAASDAPSVLPAVAPPLVSDEAGITASDDLDGPPPMPSTMHREGSGGTNNRASSVWKPEEDEALRKAVAEHSSKNWKAIAAAVPSKTSIQCLHRWRKVLDPQLIKGSWTVRAPLAAPCQPLFTGARTPCPRMPCLPRTMPAVCP